MAIMLRRLFTFFSLSIMCLPTLAKADNVAVALVMPKAGSYQQQGAELTKGVQRAIDEINESGGLLGKKLELTINAATVLLFLQRKC